MSTRTDQAGAARIRADALGAIGHDLRSAPARMLQYLELAAPSQVPAQLHASLSACARIQLQLVDDLLLFSRQELDAPHALAAPACLYGLMQQVAYDAGAASGGAAPRWACAGAVPAVIEVDAAMLAQLLARLLAHVGREGRSGQCVLTVAPAHPDALPVEGRTLLLRFSAGLAHGDGDTQAPLAPLALPHPLEGGVRGACGPALNLAVAQQLARALGGGLQAGAGAASAQLVLDLAAMVCNEADAALPMPAPETGADVGRSWTVLMMGEPDLASELLADLLENGGFTICRALSSSAALELLERMEAQPQGLARVLVVAGDARATRPLATDAWDLLQKIARRYAARMPPVVLHAAQAPQRPPGVAPGLAFAAILYRPLRQALVFDQLRRLMAAPAVPAAAAR